MLGTPQSPPPTIEYNLFHFYFAFSHTSCGDSFLCIDWDTGSMMTADWNAPHIR